eukprot:5474326-Amphidinium_carterae.1
MVLIFYFCWLVLGVPTVLPEVLDIAVQPVLPYAQFGAIPLFNLGCLQSKRRTTQRSHEQTEHSTQP